MTVQLHWWMIPFTLIIVPPLVIKLKGHDYEIWETDLFLLTACWCTALGIFIGAFFSY